WRGQAAAEPDGYDIRPRGGPRPDWPVRLHVGSARRYLAHDQAGRGRPRARAGPVRRRRVAALQQEPDPAAPRRAGGAQGEPADDDLSEAPAGERGGPGSRGPREG